VTGDPQEPNEPETEHPADPTRPAPGLGPDEQDPIVAIATEPDVATARPHRTNAGRLWVAIAVATVLLVLLIIFIAENSQQVTISFLGAHGHIALGLALLIAAVVGAVIALLAGTTRIVQLRREVRRHRRT
jgi:uncharacterized integral membrane protein